MKGFDLVQLVSLGDLFPFDNELGYLSILLISFVGSIIVFIPVPYVPVLLAAALSGKLDPHLIAVSSAVGAVIAKTVIFSASYYGRNLLSAKTRKRMLPLQRLVSRYGWPGAFIAAATPVPDDVVYIPLGLAKYSPWKFVTATFAGKVAMNELIVWSAIFLGRPLVEDVVTNTQDTVTLVILTVASVAIMGLVIYYSLRIDWGRIIGKWFPWAVKDDDEEEKP